MVNPFDPPLASQESERRIQVVPFWALLAYGIVPVAIIATGVMESFLFPTRGWNMKDWFWAVGPPAYLTAAWTLALYIHNRRSRALIASFAIFLIPLLLYALRIWSISAELYFLLIRGFEGFGLNSHFRLTAVGLPLWFGASVAYVLYFCSVILNLLRLTAFTSHASLGEPSDARETSAESVVNSHFTPRSP